MNIDMCIWAHVCTYVHRHTMMGWWEEREKVMFEFVFNRNIGV